MMDVKMMYLSVVLVLCIALSQRAFCDDGLPIASHTMFPKGFMFGAATAAFQIEGGWNADGKGMSIWDNITHEHPDYVALKENADVSDDSYHLYKEDVQLLKEIGVYRFSISWPRVLPNGRTSHVNQAGINYYMNLIDELLANDIQPMVTLYHWDLPQALQDIGGWMNPEIVSLFEEYADLMFRTYGDKVKWWITINEPFSVIWGYGGTAGAPNLNLHGTADYLVGHNLLRAHGKAYRLYQKKYSHQGEMEKLNKLKEGYEKGTTFNLPSLTVLGLCKFLSSIKLETFETKGVKVKNSREIQGNALPSLHCVPMGVGRFLPVFSKACVWRWMGDPRTGKPIFSKRSLYAISTSGISYGKLSMAFCGPMCQPKTQSPSDLAAAERCYQFSYGWFAHPVFKGDYPPIMRELVDKNSKEEGRNVSRLPYFSQEEINEINGTVDFFGMNYYTTNLINDGVIGDFPSVTRDAHYLTSFDPSWPSSEADWLKIVPQGIRLLSNKVKEEYGNPIVIVTENGYPQAALDDQERISYFESHFAEMRRAIYEDDCNIIGHTTWSIIDNFEWKTGYTNKFGIVSVDFNDPNRTRTMRKSAKWFQNYLAMHKLQ